MSERKRTVTQVGEANEALEELLGTLLAEVPGYPETPPAAGPASEPASGRQAPGQTAPPVPDQAPTQPATEAATDRATGAAAKTLPETPAAAGLAAPAVEQLSATEAALKNASGGPIETPEDGNLPDWAEQDFKALLVCIGKLRFAVPLVSLTGIARLQSSDSLTAIPGQPGWYRGVTRHRGEKLVVVDLGRLLGMSTEPVENGYLLVIGDGRYGLACSALAEQLTLGNGSVNWRQSSAGRDWQLGMLPEQMCVLLDLDAVTRRLDAGSG